jgi:hypothetical protein
MMIVQNQNMRVQISSIILTAITFLVLCKSPNFDQLLSLTFGSIYKRINGPLTHRFPAYPSAVKGSDAAPVIKARSPNGFWDGFNRFANKPIEDWF